jgi:hypothetical protein
MTKHDLPSVDRIKEKAETVKKRVELQPESKLQYRVIDDGVGYHSREVVVKNLTQLQRENMKRLVRDLEDQGAVLKDGRLVTDKSKAIRYLLENAYGVNK